MSEGRTERRWGFIQTILAVAIAAGTVMGVFAGYITLPQKVRDFEASQLKLQQRVDDSEKSRLLDREILVRLEEQMRMVRQTQEEIKNDIKTLRRP